jgi:hypothetical protein
VTATSGRRGRVRDFRTIQYLDADELGQNGTRTGTRAHFVQKPPESVTARRQVRCPLRKDRFSGGKPVDRTLAPASVIGRFIAEAAAKHIHAPVRLLDQDARAWEVIELPGDLLLLDEFGDLWWGARVWKGEARVTRPCWPEEARALARSIELSLQELSR